ncbi:substrate-binding domain-containing protein, partial [Klebsiella pneumoniae]|uniref:substrate-binding domain-containing protein n=1 Tax=Klebsiella pneumoniae TaxID=573 RepID=UPI00273911B2
FLDVIEVHLEDVDSGRSAASQDAELAAGEPISVFCGNDLIAVGLMFGLQEMGIRVPQDVALCGYDDIDLARYLATPLTSVSQSMRQIGEAAFDLLMDEMTSSDHVHRQVVFEPDIEPRASTVA